MINLELEDGEVGGLLAALENYLEGKPIPKSPYVREQILTIREKVDHLWLLQHKEMGE